VALSDTSAEAGDADDGVDSQLQKGLLLKESFSEARCGLRGEATVTVRETRVSGYGLISM